MPPAKAIPPTRSSKKTSMPSDRPAGSLSRTRITVEASRTGREPSVVPDAGPSVGGSGVGVIFENYNDRRRR